MKTKLKISKSFPLGILFLAVSINSFCYQDNIKGLWEGLFMQQFEMEILFSVNEGEILSGKIKMYDGSTLIQDDDIKNIEFKDNFLFFLIPAKETSFEGQLNSDRSEFKGDFIFPDGSRHAVLVVKKNTNANPEKSLTVVDRDILEKKYSSSQLIEDILFLRGHLSEIHPQYHLYTSEETYDALFYTVNQNLGSELTLREFHNLASPIVSNIGCSHTGIRLPDNYIKAQHRYNYYFPLKLFIKNDKAWTVSSTDDKNFIEPGSEIVRINNVPVENIITRLLTFIPAEGYNKSTKYYVLNKNFGSYFNLINNSGQFQIDYIKPGSKKTGSMSISAVPYSSLYSVNDAEISLSPTLLPLITEQSTAILDIPSFALPDVNCYLNLMDSIFEVIHEADIHNLVLDFRGNHGGHPIFAAILYSHLSSDEFTYFQENDQVPEFQPLYEPMKAASNNFTGKCYSIVDGGCLSTTGHLISLLKYYNRAVFIGEEPGSWFYCNDNSKQYKLPNTEIEVNIPQTTFRTTVEGYKMGNPFEVDYPMDMSIEDQIKHSDPWMEYTLDLIRSSYGIL